MALMDYATEDLEKAAHDEAVRIAGILDLFELMKYIGKPATAAGKSAIRGELKAAPEMLYRDEAIFADPMGRTMLDTGPTYVGRDLPEYNTLTDLVQGDHSLMDYLQGTEAGDMFKADLGRIRVGRTDLPSGYKAGYTAPQGFTDPATGEYRLVQPGFMAFDKSIPKSEIGPTFEHEMQHAYQNILGMPRGTTMDEMSSDVVQYLMDTGKLSPNKLARIDKSAVEQGASKPYMRYASSIGEAEARAAEMRQRSLEAGFEAQNAPLMGHYAWTHSGPEVSKSMLYAIPPDTDQAFKEWWRNRWKK